MFQISVPHGMRCRSTGNFIRQARRPIPATAAAHHMGFRYNLHPLLGNGRNDEASISARGTHGYSSFAATNDGTRPWPHDENAQQHRVDALAERAEMKGLARGGSWFYPAISEVPERTWDLFHGYCGISRENIHDHWERIREKAFKIFPYPCIGQHRFLNLTLSTHFLYPEIISRLRDSSSAESEAQSLIDIGCCMGQDLRKLVYDGVPADRLTGLDRDSRFVDLSFELFGDRATFAANLVASDLLSNKYQTIVDVEKKIVQLTKAIHSTDMPPGSNPSYLIAPPEGRRMKLVELPSLYGQHDIVAATSFFHLYNLGEQLELAKRVAHMMKRRPGSLIVGRQVASTVPGEYNSISENDAATRFAHDPTTWQALWDRVGAEIASDEESLKRRGILSPDVEFRGFKLDTRIDTEELGRSQNQGQRWADPNIRRMLFSIRRM